MQIIADGRLFKPEHNAHWLDETRPIPEAFSGGGLSQHGRDRCCHKEYGVAARPEVYSGLQDGNTQWRNATGPDGMDHRYGARSAALGDRLPA